VSGSARPAGQACRVRGGIGLTAPGEGPGDWAPRQGVAGDVL